MRILAFTDVHGNNKYLDSILNKSKNADLLVCSGDLTLFSNNLRKMLKKLEKTKKKILIIPGNHEQDYELKKIRSKYIIDLHSKTYDINDYTFIGYGGGGFSYINREFEKVSDSLIKKIKNKKVIFVIHQPPYNTKTDSLPGVGHVGNKSYRKFIDKVKPILVITGHLHENFNKKERIKNTVIINPGPRGKIIKV